MGVVCCYPCLPPVCLLFTLSRTFSVIPSTVSHWIDLCYDDCLHSLAIFLRNFLFPYKTAYYSCLFSINFGFSFLQFHYSLLKLLMGILSVQTYISSFIFFVLVILAALPDRSSVRPCLSASRMMSSLNYSLVISFSYEWLLA